MIKILNRLPAPLRLEGLVAHSETITEGFLSFPRNYMLAEHTEQISIQKSQITETQGQGKLG